MKITKVVSGLLGILILFVSPSLSFAAEKVEIKEGVECKKSSDKKTVGKKNFLCTNTIYGLRYVQLKSVPNKSSEYVKQLNTYVNTLNSLDFNPIQTFIQNKNSIIAEAGNPNTQLNDLNSQLAKAKEDLALFEARVPQLPGLIANEEALISSLNSQKKSQETNMNAIRPQLDLLSAEYGTALNNQAAQIACQVGVTFGVASGPCSSNPYWSQVISRYNSYEATYNSYYNNWISFNDRVNQSYAKINSFKQEKSNTKKILKDKRWLVKDLEKQISGISGGTNLKQVKVNSIPIIETNLPGLIDRRNLLVSEIQSVASAPGKNWQKDSAKLYKKIKIFMFDVNQTYRIMSY